MSPLELRREFEADTLRRRDAMDHDIATAWYVAAFSRQEKLPTLKSLLSRTGGRQTRQEALDVLHTLSSQYGIPLREVVH